MPGIQRAGTLIDAMTCLHEGIGRGLAFYPVNRPMAPLTDGEAPRRQEIP